MVTYWANNNPSIIYDSPGKIWKRHPVRLSTNTPVLTCCKWLKLNTPQTHTHPINMNHITSPVHHPRFDQGERCEGGSVETLEQTRLTDIPHTIWCLPSSSERVISWCHVFMRNEWTNKADTLLWRMMTSPDPQSIALWWCSSPKH